MYKEHSITLEFTVEEHALLNDVLVHCIDTMYFSMGSMSFKNLSDHCELHQRLLMLESIKERSCDLWMQRYND